MKKNKVITLRLWCTKALGLLMLVMGFILSYISYNNYYDFYDITVSIIPVIIGIVLLFSNRRIQIIRDL